MRKPKNFYSSLRPKLRQSWNKVNLYNIAKFVGREPQVQGAPTFFQQKWAAKSKTRGYHGEHIPEKKWVRMFSRRLLSAVDMPPQYLAKFDGSEQAAGRGSGLTDSSETAARYSKAPQPSSLAVNRQRTKADGGVNETLSREFAKMTPYMQMTFAPLERRLDTAVFRALFASSVRQARQFVIHGAVTVNGKKMVHPSYQLNPGDMFQVDVEKVMFATGKQRSSTPETGKVDSGVNFLAQTAAMEQSIIRRSLDQESPALARQAQKENEAEGNEVNSQPAEDGSQKEPEPPVLSAADASTEEEIWRIQHAKSRQLTRAIKKLLKCDPTNLSTREKVRLRHFRLLASHLMALPKGSENDVDELMSELRVFFRGRDMLAEKFDKFHITEGEDGSSVLGFAPVREQSARSPKSGEVTKESESTPPAAPVKLSWSEVNEEERAQLLEKTRVSHEDLRAFKQLLRKEAENPVDKSKPYRTPWEPRPFMNAFAFIPRYLEVNPTICAAVYLRHPVARKGMAEVPTPFSYLTNQLAHNWYLGRG